MSIKSLRPLTVNTSQTINTVQEDFLAAIQKPTNLVESVAVSNDTRKAPPS